MKRLVFAGLALLLWAGVAQAVDYDTSSLTWDHDGENVDRYWVGCGPTANNYPYWAQTTPTQTRARRMPLTQITANPGDGPWCCVVTAERDEPYEESPMSPELCFVIGDSGALLAPSNLRLVVE